MRRITGFNSNVPVHATLQVAFTQLSAFIVVDAAEAAQTSQVLLHDWLAFRFVIQRERTSLRGVRSRGDLATAWAAETHSGGVEG